MIVICTISEAYIFKLFASSEMLSFEINLFIHFAWSVLMNTQMFHTMCIDLF
jgi:hypothetical protein